MAWGRVLSSAATVAAVAGCAVVAVGMSRSSGSPGPAAATPFVMPTLSHSTYVAPSHPVTPLPATTTVVPAHAGTSATNTEPVVARPTQRASSAARPSTPAAARTTARPRVAVTAPHGTPTSAPRVAVRTPAPVRGQRLPLSYATGTATRVITVVAHSAGSTTATLQAWSRAPGGGWLRHGSPVTAHIGSDGMSRSPSESRSATPIGTFTLTQAFGYYGNPGTGLRYFKTTAADWWISQAGPLYNTHQRCSGGCGFRLGGPNEHLMYETPFYNYAVVIDYNTRNSPSGVRQGAGSAFFLHVTDGSATAGCVAIPQAKLVSIMKWLSPTAHPRILIGVA